MAAASFQEQERRTLEYRKRDRACAIRSSSIVNDQVATMNFLYCHADDGMATAAGGQMFNTFMLLNGHLLWSARCTRRPRTSRSPTLPPPPDAARTRTHRERRPVPDGIAIGDPDRIVKAIKVWEEIGVDAVNFVLNTAEVIPQEDVLSSMRLFASEVLPAFNSGRP